MKEHIENLKKLEADLTRLAIDALEESRDNPDMAFAERIKVSLAASKKIKTIQSLIRWMEKQNWN